MNLDQPNVELMGGASAEFLDNDAVVAILGSLFEGAILATLGERRVVYANASALEWMGRSAASISGLPIESLLSLTTPNDLATHLPHAAHYVEDSPTMAGELLVASGEPLGVDVRLQSITLNDEPLIAILLQRATQKQDIKADSPLTADRRDPLTGLADRSFLMSRLESLLQKEPARKQMFAVLFIDLDTFKQINDDYGHLVGDQVLQQVAQRLTSYLRSEDHIVRFGGDEFVVLVDEISHRKEVDPIVDRIHAALAAPIELPDRQMTLAVSIGVTIASSQHRTAEDILAEADRAMYASKRAGRIPPPGN